ncbi:MAG: 2OG-Fe(II) oxygenase [Mycolicibacter algericus]|uniref:2OG-Fe(II) oxygenase n=1 Tax=Mycolicibacter algericus TaxID=1288388 RepID=UPI003C78A627
MERRLKPDDPAWPAAKRLVTTVGQQRYDLDATGVTIEITMTLLQYAPGAAMPRHSDNQHEGRRGSLLAAAFGQPQPRIPRTLFACCFYLTDPSQYDGGGLVIDGYAPMRPELGEAVFIRGDVPHSVSEVTRDRRHVVKVAVMTPAIGHATAR